MNKSGFMTFLLSFIPGCGQMYLGYMKKGAQTMIMFCISCFLLSFTSDLFYYSSNWLMVLFALVLPVIWFYQFFETMHLRNRMKKLELHTPDDDGFYLVKPLQLGVLKSRTFAKIAAVVLIFIGAWAIFNNALEYLYRWVDYNEVRVVIDAVRNNLIPTLVSLVLIIAGIKLLVGSKKKNGEGNGNNAE